MANKTRIGTGSGTDEMTTKEVIVPATSTCWPSAVVPQKVRAAPRLKLDRFKLLGGLDEVNGPR